MAADWFPGADTSHKASVDGGSILGGAPKMLWHDTESSGLPSYSSGSFPHFTLDPKSGKVWQHIPASRAARALKNVDGGCQTNRWNVLQVEVIGYVNAIGYHAAMGELAAWAQSEHGVPGACSVDRLRYDASYGATSVRLSCGEWDGYSGHLYHMSAPENDHGDPGDPFPMSQILDAAGGEMTKDEFLDALNSASAQDSLARAVKSGLDQSLAKWQAAPILVVAPQARSNAAYAVLPGPGGGQLVHLPNPTIAGTYLGGNSLADAIVVLPAEAPIWQLPVNGLELPDGYPPSAPATTGAGAGGEGRGR